MKRLIRETYSKLMGFLPDKVAIPIHFRMKAGYWPNLSTPSTFNEKIQHRKLHGDQQLYARRADKILVKDFVSETIGPQFVIPTIWKSEKLPPVEQRIWETPCVVKVNHGSGGNYFARSSLDLFSPNLDRKIKKWMSSSFNPHLKESFYDLICRQVFVEPMIGDNLIDYKFYVFGGVVQFIHVDTDRFSVHRRQFYDRDWNLQDFTLQYPRLPGAVEKPQHFFSMIEAAEELGKNIDFVRVDFYDTPAGPKFSEMTFSPGGGCEPFSPVEFDKVLGSFWI